MSQEFKFNPGRFGKKLHALFEGVYKEEEWKDDVEDAEEDETAKETPEANGEKEETTAAPTETPAEDKEEGGEVEEKEHESVEKLADAAQKVQDAVSTIKTSEELEHDGTITPEDHEKIEAKAAEKLESASGELNAAKEEFKAAEQEEGNPDINGVQSPTAGAEETEVAPIDEKKSKLDKKFDSCVKQVAAKGKVDNPHAVCMVSTGKGEKQEEAKKPTDSFKKYMA